LIVQIKPFPEIGYAERDRYHAPRHYQVPFSKIHIAFLRKYIQVSRIDAIVGVKMQHE
jgi:hypothetical protein